VILDYVEIKNFRSIQFVKFSLDPRCRVLVGINESGKSNLLEALSLRSTEVTPKKEDIRQELPDEGPLTDAYVSFCFRLEESEVANIVHTVSLNVISKDMAS
jgi:predicted ATPase